MFDIRMLATWHNHQLSDSASCIIEMFYRYINRMLSFQLQDADRRPSFAQLSRTLSGLMDAGNYPHL